MIIIKLHSLCVPFCVVSLPKIYAVFHWEKMFSVYMYIEITMHSRKQLLFRAGCEGAVSPPRSLQSTRSHPHCKALGQSQGWHLLFTSHVCCPKSSLSMLDTTLVCSTHAAGALQFFSQALTCHFNSYPHEDDQWNIQNASCYWVTSRQRWEGSCERSTRSFLAEWIYYCTGLVFQLYVMEKGISVILPFGFHGAMLLSVVKETPGFFFPPCSLMSAFLFP